MATVDQLPIPDDDRERMENLARIIGLAPYSERLAALILLYNLGRHAGALQALGELKIL